MPKAYPIPAHIHAKTQPRRDGHVLQIRVNDEVSKSAWIEVHQTEGWGVRFVTDENGRIQRNPDKPDEYMQERVEAKFEAVWVPA